MYALLAALVLVQTSITVNVGAQGKATDSAAIARKAKADSARLALEDRLDSVRSLGRNRDSTEIARRRARQIQLTPALMATAFRDSRAATLLAAARRARLEQDSALTGYDATTYERMSVGLGFRRIGRDRLMMRAERASRVVWSGKGAAYVEVLGKRAVAPILAGVDDADVDIYDAVPIPYHPGRESLFIGSGLARADIAESDMIHPLARGAEAYYTYAVGDSVKFRMPGGREIDIRELLVRPRSPRWNVVLGSLWFEVSSARLVRAVYRMAEPIDIWATAKEESRDEDHEEDDDPPRWLTGIISPLKAQISAVTVEYGLHEGRFWMPRLQALEGSAQAGMFKVPFKIEQSFKYASVNGALPQGLPELAVGDTARDSVSRAARREARWAECRTEEGFRTRVQRNSDAGLPLIVRVPCSEAVLAASPELPKSIYDEGEELFGGAERDALISEALALGAQPGWSPQRPVLSYGLPLTRYNSIEGLSTGLGVHQTLGGGYTARGLVRLGIADLEPNAELGLTRTNGRSSIGITAFRRLAGANDWSDPFSFGSSLSALLFGRDEGLYYRTVGVELAGTPDDSATTAWRLFAEHHSDASREASFSIAKVLGSSGFAENIDTDNGNYLGFAVERHMTRGLDPRRFRLFSEARLEGATGEMSFARGRLDATVSGPLLRRIDGALTLGAGTSAGDVPRQRLWYLGGAHTVRGQVAGAASGDAFWMGRVELGSDFVGGRPVVFYDAGWAGPRDEFGKSRILVSGAGAGISFLDGLVRFDLARGIRPEKKIRANLYVEARF